MQPLQPRSGAPSTAALGSAAFDALARADVAPDAAFFQKYQARQKCKTVAFQAGSAGVFSDMFSYAHLSNPPAAA